MRSPFVSLLLVPTLCTLIACGGSGGVDSSSQHARTHLTLSLRSTGTGCTEDTSVCRGGPLPNAVLVFRKLGDLSVLKVQASVEGILQVDLEPDYYQVGLDYKYSYSGFTQAFGDAACNLNNTQFSCPEQSGCYPQSADNLMQTPGNYNSELDPGIEVLDSEANQDIRVWGGEQELTLVYGERCI